MKYLPVVRGDCISGTYATGSLEERCAGRKQCRVSCRHNLLLVMSEDRPGRRHGGLAPPADWTGDIVSASAASCALDVAEQNPAGMSSGEVAKLLGQTRRAAELTVKRALEKLRANGASAADVDAMTAAAFAHPAGNLPG